MKKIIEMVTCILVLTTRASAAPVDISGSYDAFPPAPFAVAPVLLRRIMVIGDSIQAGTNLVRAGNQATARLQRYGNLIVHNFSSPGAAMADTFFPGMNHATESVALLYGFTGMYGVVINLGTNDWGVAIPLTTFASVYDAFVASIPSPLKVACMGLTWSTAEGMPNANGDTKMDFRAAIQTTCTAHGAAYLDGLAAIPNDPAYFTDGGHPNDRGHKAMGRFLVRQLRTLGWVQ